MGYMGCVRFVQSSCYINIYYIYYICAVFDNVAVIYLCLLIYDHFENKIHLSRHFCFHTTYIRTHRSIQHLFRSFGVLHFNVRLLVTSWLVVFARRRTCVKYNVIIDGKFRRETRGENESREKWKRSLPRKRLGWAARTDRRGCRDRIQSLTAIRTHR